MGGKHLVPMAELRRHLESLGLQGVRSYIQSGNVVFDARQKSAASLRKKISDLVEEHFGFRPPVFLLSKEALLEAIEENPFPEGIAEPKSLHFLFLLERAKNPDLESIEQAKSATERVHLSDAVFYLHAPDGIGRSKLASKVEKRLGVACTGRNYRTVAKLLEMVISEDSN